MTTFYVSYQQMSDTLFELFSAHGFSPNKAKSLSEVFTENSACGVISHGLNRVPLFVEFLQSALISRDAEAQCVESFSSIERWDGQNGPGILNAISCTNRAIELAKAHGMGMIALKNTNHWMRGGYYAWHAAKQNCISIMFTNTKPNMPAWGGKELRIGNNPFVISLPHKETPILLDMAMSQFSYGKMESFAKQEQTLPVEGGWNTSGKLSKNPQAIIDSQQSLPIGYWKGSALAIVLDMLATVLSGGQSTYKLGQKPEETGVSQVYICIDNNKISSSHLHAQLLEEIIEFTHSATPKTGEKGCFYPGEQSFLRKKESLQHGIAVDKTIWDKVLQL